MKFVVISLACAVSPDYYISIDWMDAQLLTYYSSTSDVNGKKWIGDTWNVTSITEAC